MRNKIISEPNTSFNFYDKNGLMTPSYAIVFINSLDQRALDDLEIPQLIKSLKRFGFELPFNTHMTIGFVAINLDDLSRPYEDKDVDKYFKEARKLWEQSPVMNKFQVTMTEVEYNVQPKRNAVRLTCSFLSPEIVELKRKYNKFFNIATRIKPDVPTNLNVGLASNRVFNSQEETEIRRILTDFNKSFKGKVITVDRVNLVYHQNHFVIDNLREEEFWLS